MPEIGERDHIPLSHQAAGTPVGDTNGIWLRQQAQFECVLHPWTKKVRLDQAMTQRQRRGSILLLAQQYHIETELPGERANGFPALAIFCMTRGELFVDCAHLLGRKLAASVDLIKSLHPSSSHGIDERLRRQGHSGHKKQGGHRDIAVQTADSRHYGSIDLHSPHSSASPAEYGI